MFVVRFAAACIFTDSNNLQAAMVTCRRTYCSGVFQESACMQSWRVCYAYAHGRESWGPRFVVRFAAAGTSENLHEIVKSA